MRNWKAWMITTPFILLMVIASIVVWLWRNLSTNWGPETVAAQYVLNHTPLDHLQSYHVFTASGLQDVFKGTDAFGREWYAFYTAQSPNSYAVPATGIIPVAKVQADVLKLGVQAKTETLGYVLGDASTPFSAKSRVVYEVQGIKNNKSTFLYLDATTGHVLWQYQLQS